MTTDALLKLKALYQSNSLTREEYERMHAQIIRESGPATPIRSADFLPLAAIAFAITVVVSESLYAILGGAVWSCATNGTFCNGPAAVAGIFFQMSTFADQPNYAYALVSIGAPGLNNLFYLLFGYMDSISNLILIALIGYVIAFFAIFSFLRLSATLPTGQRILLAVAIAIGWFVLYSGIEVAIYGGNFMDIVRPRFYEIIFSTIVLLALIPFHPRSNQSNA